ncbi:MAG: GNAT family N-acetyltransferase [Pirellulales bacterium]
MIQYRAFRNSDAPQLAEIWRSGPAYRGLAQPMSVATLETYVFSKPYFHREGLQVAEQEGRLLGFVHTGPGPAADFQGTDPRVGVVSMLLVHDRAQKDEIAAALLSAAEKQLVAAGAEEIYAFGVGKINPFYLGLYGGSASPGLLESGPPWIELFESRGYRPQWSVSVLQRDLAGFRPPVDRTQMQIRRTSMVFPVLDPPPRHWWAACTVGPFDQIRFDLIPRAGGDAIARATFWNMEPLAVSWGVHALGLVDLETTPDLRRHGLATYLIGEALRQLHGEGFTLIEAQIREDDHAAQGLFHKLGFQQVDRGHVLKKTLVT